MDARNRAASSTSSEWMHLHRAPKNLKEETGMLALNRKAVELLLNDEEWSRRLESAKTKEEAVKVLTEFCRAKGLKLQIVE